MQGDVCVCLLSRCVTSTLDEFHTITESFRLDHRVQPITLPFPCLCFPGLSILIVVLSVLTEVA